MFPEPLVLFGVPIHAFGIISALSILLGYLETEKALRRLKISIDILPDLAFAVLASAFLGARLMFVASHRDYYVASPIEVFKFWEGGLVFYGGLLGGFLGGYIFCRKKKLSLSEISDPVALGIALGLALSRLGCLAAGCCFGKPSNLPWAITFDHGSSLASPLHTPLHPTQIYSFVVGIWIYFFLLNWQHKKTFKGELLLIFFALTSISRIFIDTFRADSHIITFLLASSIFIISTTWLVHIKHKTRGDFMKKPIWKLTALVLASAFFAACGIIKTQKITQGYDIATADVNSIIKGTTTEKDILKMFGPPTKMRDTNEGKEFFYEYSKSGGPQWNLVFSVGGNSVTKSLMVWFDKNGVVTDYGFKKS